MTPGNTTEGVDIGDTRSSGLPVKRALLLRRGERTVRRAAEEPNPLILGSPALSINSSLPEDENGCRADWERGKGIPPGSHPLPTHFHSLSGLASISPRVQPSTVFGHPVPLSPSLCDPIRTSGPWPSIFPRFPFAPIFPNTVVLALLTHVPFLFLPVLLERDSIAVVPLKEDRWRHIWKAVDAPVGQQ